MGRAESKPNPDLFVFKSKKKLGSNLLGGLLMGKKNGYNLGFSTDQWDSRSNKSLYCAKAGTNLN